MNRIHLLYICILLLHVSGRIAYAQHEGENENFFHHTIERGETVYAIATMYGVGVEDIYRLNPESKEGIKAGAALKIPQRNRSENILSLSEIGSYSFHTIQAKETLYALSKKYSIPASEIVKSNPGLSIGTFTIGKTIRIPPKQIEQLPITEKRTVTKNIEYTIQKKETLYRICKKFNISGPELLKLNPQLKGGVKAGMVIQIPVETEETITSYSPFSDSEREANDLLYEQKEIESVGMIKVALLLPFMTEEETGSPATQRFIEYYEGLLLAIDSLRNQGCSVELSVYDTGNGTKKLNSILKEEALKEAHLIIGAVQNEQIARVADFAQKQQIKYIIPFTSKNDDVLSNASVYQINTPHSYLYAKAAQAGCELFEKDQIILLHMPDAGDDKKDFIKIFTGEIRQRGIAFKEMTHNPETFEADIEAAMAKDRRNVIIPSSGSLEILNKIKVPLHALAETKPEYGLTLFGYPEWQTYTRECLDDFHTLNTYIYSNFYADNLAAKVSDFYSKYKKWYSKYPNNTFPKYAILGFDTGMFFLDAVRKFGIHFEDHFDKLNYPSIQTGFDFHRVNNWGGFINTHIFIVHYGKDYNVTRSEVK